ncbi:MAG: hypothetical protein IKD77_03560 [Bacilli bacterium]|nr:hypothetical protein [Bacilli bacterium]
MGKLLLISHVADEDGLTPVILAGLVYGKIDTSLVNAGEADQALLENIDKYDLIHITDLSISEELAEKINANKEYRKKIKIFDHHKSALYLNKYKFAKVIVETKAKKESATSIYYKYLLRISNNKTLRKKSTRGLVNQVRIVDTYDFKKEKDKEALNLDYLFAILGRKNYIDYFKKYIRENDKFKYTKEEKFLIKLEKDRVDNYIKQKEKEVILAKVDGYKVGIVYAESNRSIIGHRMLENQDIDFAIIINISKSISFRGEGKVDLSVFSQKYNGGGHKNASGCPLPENILKDITKKIFKKVEIEEEENE